MKPNKNWTSHQWLAWHKERTGKDFVAVPSVTSKWKKERKKWLWSEKKHNDNLCLRPLQPDEIVFEYDIDKKTFGIEFNYEKLTEQLFLQTKNRLKELKCSFYVFQHGGRSKWIRLYGVKQKNNKEKLEFVKSVCPSADDGFYIKDSHLVPIENAPHHKHKHKHELIEYYEADRFANT